MLIVGPTVPISGGMFRTTLNLSTTLADELRRLPSPMLTYVLDDAYLTVGPTGVFVLVEGDDDVTAACRVAAARASSVRAELADQMAFVPFVDAVVTVTDHGFDPAQPAVVIPHDLVRFTVCEGRRIIDDEMMARLHLLRLPRLV